VVLSGQEHGRRSAVDGGLRDAVQRQAEAERYVAQSIQRCTSLRPRIPLIPHRPQQGACAGCPTCPRTVNAGDTTRRISFGKLVGPERSISRPVSWESCDRRKSSTRSVASWYLRSLTQAFSMFLASWAKTNAQFLDGGVKVFTF